MQGDLGLGSEAVMWGLCTRPPTSAPEASCCRREPGLWVRSPEPKEAAPHQGVLLASALRSLSSRLGPLNALQLGV